MGHLTNLWFALGKVFCRPLYVLVAVTLAMATFLLAVLFPNIELIGEVFSGSDTPLASSLAIILGLLGGIATNFSLLSAGYTIAIALLFGLVAAMIVYLIAQRRVAAAGQNIALGSGALASGVLGVGCAACGTLILGAAVPSLGAAAAIAALPLNGAEFGILSVVLLFVSLLLIGRSIAAAAACPLPWKRGHRVADGF